MPLLLVSERPPDTRSEQQGDVQACRPVAKIWKGQDQRGSEHEEGHVEEHSDHHHGCSELARDAAALEQFDTRLQCVCIYGGAGNRCVAVERGLDVHRHVVEKPLVEKTANHIWPAAVRVELDGEAQTAHVAEEPREVFLDCRLAASDDDAV